MSAASEVCHHCNKQGHYKRNCPELQIKNKGKRETTKKTLRGKGCIWRRRRADVVLTLQHADAL